MRGEQLLNEQARSDQMRIIPACAGSSFEHWQIAEVDKDHPRMRGEQLVRGD